MDKDPELQHFQSGTRRFEPSPKPTLAQALESLRKGIVQRPFKRYRTRGYTPQDLAVMRRIVGERDDE